MTLWFGLPHSFGLVALSVVMAVFGGYVGLGLAGQARLAAGFQRRGLLAGAAWSLGLGIWTMHFVGMLAVQLPDDAQYSVLLTLLSFLLCVLVVGIAAFLVCIGSSNRGTVALASLIMGAGIVGMHYLGMHAIAGSFMLHHDWRYVLAAALIAVASSYGALRIFETPMRHQTLAMSALIFGLAVSVEAEHRTLQQHTLLVPVENEGATRLIPAADIFAIQATTHYTLVYDGRHEHFSPWSITEAEARLDREQFMRVHRSHLIAIDKVKALRKSGDGAVVEVGGPSPA